MKIKNIITNLRLKWRIYKLTNKAKQEKRRCAAAYEDWQDDEYNMGPCKFIWGVQRNKETNPSFCTLNDITVYYNRDTDMYFLLIDFPANLKQEQDKLQFLIQCLQAFQVYMQSLPNGYTFAASIEEDFDTWNLYGKTIDELYVKFAALICGYKAILKQPE